MQLSFDSKRLINDIIKELNIEMDSVCKVLIEFMAGEISMSSTTNAKFAQWKDDVINSLRFRAVASSGQLLREIGILNQDMSVMYKAMAVEFGTGRFMSDSSVNPWLGEYLSSEYYHTSRQGTGIYSLPGEEVYDPDENSWRESSAESRVAMPFLEERGSLYWTNIFGNSSIMAETYFNKGIENAIDRIDFSKYLEVK